MAAVEQKAMASFWGVNLQAVKSLRKGIWYQSAVPTQLKVTQACLSPPLHGAHDIAPGRTQVWMR